MTTCSRVSRIGVAALLAAVLLACGNAQEIVRSAPASRRLPVGPMDERFAGLYLPPEVSVLEVGDTWVHLGSTMPCAVLAEVLGSGQWTVTDAFNPPPEFPVALLSIGGIVPLVRMERATAVAFAALEGVDRCDAVVTQAATGPLRISGTATYEGLGAGVATQCIGSTDQVAVAAWSDDRAGGLGVFARFTVPVGATGAQPMPPGDDDSVGLVDYEQRGLLGTYQDLLTAGLAAGEGAEDLTAADLGITTGPLGLRNLVPGFGYAGTADIISTEPLAGSVHLEGLADEQTGEPFSVDLTFACDRVLTITDIGG